MDECVHSKLLMQLRGICVSIQKEWISLRIPHRVVRTIADIIISCHFLGQSHSKLCLYAKHSKMSHLYVLD